MEFIDLKAQYAALKSEIDTAVLRVLEHADYILGNEVTVLEKALAEYTGAKFCVTCANGTDALSLAMEVLGIGKGDAVFLPDFTFFATAETVTKIGATPVFVDVDETTFNISAAKLLDAAETVKKQKKLRLAAIIPVDLFGLPCDYDKIQKIADEFSIKILEDGAQGFGGSYKNKRACSFGDISTTSFFPAKPLGCYGDGGALFTDNAEYDRLLRSLRFHGKGGDKYDNVRIGVNSRLDTVQAAVLNVKLKAFREFELKRRGEIAALYDNLLAEYVVIPKIPDGFISSYAQYTILLENGQKRDKLKTYLDSEGIPSMIYYPKCMHEQTAYRTNEYLCFDASVSESLTKKVLSLPMHPYLTDGETEKIAVAVKRGLHG